jgi:hypothetical protein
MKPTSALSAFAASALFASLLAGCASWSGDQAGSSQTGGGMQGRTASGSGQVSAECDQFYQMESEHTPSDQLALIDQNMRRMTPAMRDRYTQRMRQTCGQPPDNG